MIDADDLRTAAADDRPDERPVPGLPIMLTLEQGIDDLLALSRLPLYPTPFPTLNDSLGLGGLIAGQVFIIAGGAGAGKTTLILGMANHHAREHGPVLFVTLEMRVGHCIARAAAPHLGCSANALIRGEVSVIAATCGVSPNITFVERCTLPQLEAATAELRRRTGKTPLVVVDYLQLLAAQVLAMMVKPDARLATTDVSSALRTIARKLDAPILAVSSASRGSAAKMRGQKGNDPRTLPPGELIDVAKESGDIEYDAAGIFALHVQPELDIDGCQVGTLTVAKARFGRPCHIAMAYDGEQASWMDRGRVAVRTKTDTVDAGQISVERLNQRTELQARIVVVLSAGPMPKERLREALKANRDALADAVSDLLQTGRLVTTGKGKASRLRLADDLVDRVQQAGARDVHAS